MVLRLQTMMPFSFFQFLPIWSNPEAGFQAHVLSWYEEGTAVTPPIYVLPAIQRSQTPTHLQPLSVSQYYYIIDLMKQSQMGEEYI